MTLTDRLIGEIREEFPNFRLIPKSESVLSRALDLSLKIVTLGGQRGYLTVYHTVIGDTLYVPTSWRDATDTERAVILRHERVHLRQRRRYGTWLMTLLYLVPFFPLGLAYGRARIEWEAYAETLRATWEILGPDAARAPELRQKIVRRFTGPDYGWMWPFRATVERWYDEALESIERRERPANDGHAAGPAAHGERAA